MDKYLNATEVESAIIGLANGYPDLCELIQLPNPTVGEKISHALRIGMKNNFTKPGVLIMACAHARELGGAEISINFATDLLNAFRNQTGVQYGGKIYSVSDIDYIMSSLDVFVFPLINPDGREYCQTTNPGWRKNRNNPAVDLNRNYDFLWHDPSFKFNNPGSITSEFYKGPKPESENETRNVIWLVRKYPQIGRLMDIHSGSGGKGETILWGWSNAYIQSTDPSESFSPNPLYDNQRGDAEISYQEYMPPKDAGIASKIAGKLRDVIQEVRGKIYTADTGISYYGEASAGLATDYFYSLNLEYPPLFKRPPVIRILGFGIEFAKQSPVVNLNEMELIIADVDAALFQFCLMALPVRMEWNAFLANADWPFSLASPMDPPDEKMMQVLYMTELAMQITDEAVRNKTMKLLLNHALELTTQDENKKRNEKDERLLRDYSDPTSILVTSPK